MHSHKKKYSLVWQKWVDPLGGDEMSDSVPIGIPEDIGDFEDDMGVVEEDIEETPLKHHGPTKAIMTPMGLIPYNELTASGKIFNFWTGHTNFNISPPVVGILQSANGVEALDVFTRYRFRIAIGQLFEPAIVMSNITNNIYSYLEKEYG